MLSNNIKTPVIALAIGGEFAGKSQTGCVFLQNKDALKLNDNNDETNHETIVQCNIIDGIKRYYIDTGAIYCLRYLIIESIFKIVGFLKEWKIGFNALFIVDNYQNDRFLFGLEKAISVINQLFNGQNLWNQTAVIKTRYFFERKDHEIRELKTREKIISTIQKSSETANEINPQIPFFYVENSEIDERTKNEYQKIFEFASKNEPIQTYQRFDIYNDDFIVAKSDVRNENYDMLVLCRSGIKVAKIPSFIKRICSYAFANCGELQIVFSNDTQLQSIGSNAFFDDSISCINLPPFVTHLYENSFLGCRKLHLLEQDPIAKNDKIDGK